MNTIPYLPYEQRVPDMQYQNLLRFIQESPETFLAKNPYQTKGRWTNLETPRLVYKYENGFPVITERKISFWKAAITELILFINGVYTFDEMIKSGCKWWADWTTPEKCKDFGLEAGDLGPGSYGPVLHNLPSHRQVNVVNNWRTMSTRVEYRPDSFNQVENLIQSLKDGPGLNTHVISTWYPPLDMQHSKLKRQVVVAPCHGTKMQFTIIGGKKLVYTMTQRSCDAPIGLVANIIQHAAFGIMVAHVCSYEPYKYIHVIDDAQIYENQMEEVNELLKRSPFPFPTLQLTEEGQKVTNIFDFKADHFELNDYQSHPAMNIPATL